MNQPILVVDDSVEIRGLLTALLELLGHRVVVACDGQEALDLLKEWRPAMVITDLHMPRMNGAELIERLRTTPTYAGMPIVVITGDTGYSGTLPGNQEPVDGWMYKPFGMQKMAEMVSRLMGYSPANTSSVTDGRHVSDPSGRTLGNEGVAV